MNVWGILIAAIGAIMIYIGVKGDPTQIVTAFRPAVAPAGTTPSGKG